MASPGGPNRAYVITASYSTFLYQLDGYPSPSFAHKYDTNTDRWASVRKIPTTRSGQISGGNAAAATVGNAIYVCGATPPTPAVTKMEAYYPVTDTWATKQNLPASHAGGALAASSTKLFFASGFVPPYGVQNTLHVYDAAADTWALGAIARQSERRSGGMWHRSQCRLTLQVPIYLLCTLSPRGR